MLNFEEVKETKMERECQNVVVTADAYARAAQYRALLMTIRTSIQNDSYNVEKVAAAVVNAFDELEGAGC